jgi:hypothetical protein
LLLTRDLGKPADIFHEGVKKRNFQRLEAGQSIGGAAKPLAAPSAEGWCAFIRDQSKP